MPPSWHPSPGGEGSKLDACNILKLLKIGPLVPLKKNDRPNIKFRIADKAIDSNLWGV